MCPYAVAGVRIFTPAHEGRPILDPSTTPDATTAPEIHTASPGRRLADRRVWPSIDITQSGTRREELLLDPDTLHAVTMLRRTLTSMHPVEAMEQLTKQLGRFKNNEEFIRLISGAKVLD